MAKSDLDRAPGDGSTEPLTTTSEPTGAHSGSRFFFLRGLRSAAGRPSRLGGLSLIIIFAGFLVICFAQASGQIEFDTSLPLVLSPISYFSTVLHLWNPTVFGGTMVQGAGFLVPQGLYFIGAQLLHVPPWVAQRIWLATLMTTGAWGVIRFAEALGIGNRWARILAGATYCIAPLMMVWVTTTGDMLAVVLLPWVLVPLVAGSRRGSTRQAAARSGIAVALMGGSNAALVLAVLAVAVIWLLTRQPGPRRRALSLWWCASVAMACFFWAVALLFAGHFGYNYLPFTETSVTTTSTASAFEAVRGASAWTAYYTIPQPLLAGAWIVVSRPLVIGATAVLAALGLAGLCRRVPERLFLVASLAFGVVVIASGYSGHLGAPFAGTVQHLLQNSLAPFRNISKFAPAVMLPLALGLAWTLSMAGEQVASARDRLGRHASGETIRRSYVRPALLIVVAVVIVIAATPFWQGQLYGEGGFAAIPSYWQEVAGFLNAHQGHGNALLVPGSNFATYTWGNPKEEPLMVLASTSVEERSLIPLGSNGNTQMLDVVEQALDSGTSPAGLASFLARAGVDYVVERNDLNLSASGAPPPAQVHQVLTQTPGLTEVASFGPYEPASQVAEGGLPLYDSTNFLHLRAVNVFRVNGASSSGVHTYPAKDPVVVSGNVGSLLPLAGADVVSGRASVLSGDTEAEGVAKTPGATWAITDGNQRRATSFGNVRDNQSYLLGPDQLLPDATEGVPLSFEVVNGVQHQTVSDPIGAASVSASSYGSSPLSNVPSEGPASAFDGNPATAWVAHASGGSVGQWLEITFDHPRRLSTITVRPLSGTPAITRLRITTDSGTVTRRLPPGHLSYRLRVAPGPSTHLKLTIVSTKTAAQSAGAFARGAGMTDVSIPGLTFEPRMRVPDDEEATFSSATAAAPVLAFQRPITNPNLTLGLTTTDDPEMARAVSLPRSEWVNGQGEVIPEPSNPLNTLIGQIDPEPADSLQITASSTFAGLPRFAAVNLVDGSPRPWIADQGDASPTLTLSWAQSAPVDSVALRLSPLASRPTSIAITPSGGTPVVEAVPARGGIIHFPTVTTDGLTIQFLHVASRALVAPDTLPGSESPVGLASISVPGIVTTPVAQPDMSTPLDLPCGFGPSIEVDGVTVPTSVTGTVGDLIDLRPLSFALCPPLGALPLLAGDHTLQADSPFGPWEVTSMVLEPVGGSTTSTVAHRTASTTQWSSQRRTLEMSAGPATDLVVAQNFNSAWVARMDGHTLHTLRVDGWEQGFLVPAGGKASVVTLSVPANPPYEALLIFGLALLVVLVAMALVPAGDKGFPDGGPRRSPNLVVLLSLSALALFVISGPLALALVPLVFIGRRWGPTALSIAAFAAFALAGVAAALTPAAPGVVAGTFGAPAQAASVVAIAAVLASVAVEGWGPDTNAVHKEFSPEP